MGGASERGTGRQGAGRVAGAPPQSLALSVVVPAYNEEKLLPGTLHAIAAAVSAAGYAPGQWELRVADNASTDATAHLARAAGAVVVHEPRRQIARARNAGAAQARGRWLLFVDADTLPNASLLGATREVMDSGRCCGGSTVVAARGGLPARVIIRTWNAISRLLRLACGGYLFCLAEAFRDVGGFDEALYAAEDVELSWRLRRWGARRGLGFRILTRSPLHTSLRKLELYAPGELAMMALRALLRPHRMLKERRFLDAWYDGRR